MNPYQPASCDFDDNAAESRRFSWWLGTWRDVRNGLLILVAVAVVGLLGSAVVPRFLKGPEDPFAAQCAGAFLAIIGVGGLLLLIAIASGLCLILLAIIRFFLFQFHISSTSTPRPISGTRNESRDAGA